MRVNFDSARFGQLKLARSAAIAAVRAVTGRVTAMDASSPERGLAALGKRLCRAGGTGCSRQTAKPKSDAPLRSLS